MIEDFEHFTSIDQTRYIRNHAVAFVVMGLACKWKQPLGYFLRVGPITSTVLQSLIKATSMHIWMEIEYLCIVLPMATFEERRQLSVYLNK